jgi:hypothetical protein
VGRAYRERKGFSEQCGNPSPETAARQIIPTTQSTPAAMKYRKLRIAWSVAWGLVAVLLCVLWVRSYSYWDGLHAGHQSIIDSWDGRVWVICKIRNSNFGWLSQTTERQLRLTEMTAEELHAWPHFKFALVNGRPAICLPHCLIVVLGVTLAALPWLRPRFSLRTLLIATTLVAVVLCIIVWMSRTG